MSRAKNNEDYFSFYSKLLLKLMNFRVLNLHMLYLQDSSNIMEENYGLCHLKLIKTMCFVLYLPNGPVKLSLNTFNPKYCP